MRSVRPRRSRPAGFTLIEVLVALVVVAVSVTAVLHSASVASRTMHGLEDRFFARMVASEEITALKLERDFPAVGITTGNRRMASQTWNWETRITQTAEPKMRRVEVTVSNELQQVVTVAAYISDRIGPRAGE
jgi:general secretion pathway protein I